MKLVHKIDEVREVLRDVRSKGMTIGYVSTLGNLHAGHTSLVTIGKKHSDYIVSSIFLNPQHFAPDEDYDAYPRTLDEDCRLLQQVECDLAFAPSIQEMYPLGLAPQAQVNVPILDRLHCGVSRPHHFGAVATIVTKSFNIIQPDVALFGEKDFQQLALVRRMALTLNFPIKIVSGPTVREESGLAMSSRNNLLDPDKIGTAPLLYKCLLDAKAKVEKGERDYLRVSEEIKDTLSQSGFRPDYINFANPETLEPAKLDDKSVVLLAAAWLGKVRLIDNIMIESLI